MGVFSESGEVVDELHFARHTDRLIILLDEGSVSSSHSHSPCMPLSKTPSVEPCASSERFVLLRQGLVGDPFPDSRRNPSRRESCQAKQHEDTISTCTREGLGRRVYEEGVKV